MSKKTLWVMNVGSHLWGMNRPDSDLDLFECYVAPTRDILSGRTAPGGAHFSQKDGIDLQSHEVGKWVDMLLKMNLNYLIGLFSPLIYQEDNPRKRMELRHIIENGLSQQAYYPIRGMVQQNFRKYVESGADTSERRLNKIARVAAFGVLLLTERRLVFNAYSGSTVEDIRRFLELLDVAKRQSPLPEFTPTETVEAARNWLMHVRLDEMEGML